MLPHGKGTILFTVRGELAEAHRVTRLPTSNWGLRAVAQSMARELAPEPFTWRI